MTKKRSSVFRHH